MDRHRDDSPVLGTPLLLAAIAGLLAFGGALIVLTVLLLATA